MTIKLGVVMDVIESIYPEEDTTLLMMLEAQKRGWTIYYMQQNDLFFKDNIAQANAWNLKVYDSTTHWFDYGHKETLILRDLDVILMRKNPPFNMPYFYATQLLELAEKQGVLVINKPSSLRDLGEKIFPLSFPGCFPETVIASNKEELQEFIFKHKKTILKPLNDKGGESVFYVEHGDTNVNVIIEVMTHSGEIPVVAQKFISAIQEGDKRILMINGEPVLHAYARMPAPGEHRGNLCAGGSGEVVALNKHDRWLCERIGPTLREKGLLFVGLDVIGDYVTEINITSPTCARQIDAIAGTNIAARFWDVVESML